MNPDAISYSTAIKCCEASRKAEPALQLLREMRLSSGVRPDGITYLAVLNTCSRAALLQETLAVLEEIKREYGLV